MRQLDTNILVAYLRGNPSIVARIDDRADEFALSSLVLAELLYGARTSLRAAENLSRVRQLGEVLEVVPFTEACADVYGEIRAELRRIGRPSGDIDTLIASVAIAHGAVLVTNNSRHFTWIDRLQLETWPN